jgi:hypothetical protein
MPPQALPTEYRMPPRRFSPEHHAASSSPIGGGSISSNSGITVSLADPRVIKRGKGPAFSPEGGAPLYLSVSTNHCANFMVSCWMFPLFLGSQCAATPRNIQWGRCNAQLSPVLCYTSPQQRPCVVCGWQHNSSFVAKCGSACGQCLKCRDSRCLAVP